MNNLIPTRHLNLQDFELLVTLGEGAFGKVKLAKRKGYKRKYRAIKILKKTHIIKQRQIDHIKNEATILSTISHPFMVYMDGFMQDARNIYLVLEFVRGGELFEYLSKVKKLEVEQTTQYIAQVVCMFEYLHSKDIIYRDLKPENLLIDEHGYLKLTDFGLAKEIDEGRTYTVCGTPQYLAPEVILNKGHGYAVDYWAVGVLLYELLAGHCPFEDDEPINLYQKILTEHIKFPKHFNKKAKSLVRHLMQDDLSKRYGNMKNGVGDIKHHKFFKGFDWDGLLQYNIVPQYVPQVQGKGDISNFADYPASTECSMKLKPAADPFLDW